MGIYYHFQPKKVVFIFKDFKNALNVCVVGLCARLHVVACRVQKRTLDPLELELQAVAGCPARTLKTELGPSTKATPALPHRALSLPTHSIPFLDTESTQPSLDSNSQPSSGGMRTSLGSTQGLESVQGQAASYWRMGGRWRGVGAGMGCSVAKVDVGMPVLPFHALRPACPLREGSLVKMFPWMKVQEVTQQSHPFRWCAELQRNPIISFV